MRLTFFSFFAQVLEWLSLPPEDRPSWVSLYFDEPDHQGHSTGPHSPELDNALKKVEEAVKELMRGLVERELLHCVNLLFVSDHGMVQRRTDPLIDLAVSVPNISEIADVIYGQSAKIMLKNPSLGEKKCVCMWGGGGCYEFLVVDTCNHCELRIK